MSNRKLLAALVLAAASSTALVAPVSNVAQAAEGAAACTATAEGTAEQTSDFEACGRYRYPHG